jgi:hypothetical protein
VTDIVLHFIATDNLRSPSVGIAALPLRLPCGRLVKVLIKLGEQTSDDRRGVEFLVAIGGVDGELIRIRRGAIERGLQVAWIGDLAGFERFQRERNRPLDDASSLLQAGLPPGRDFVIKPGDDVLTSLAQTVAEGGCDVSVVPPADPGTPALGLSFARARLGMLYLPLQLDGAEVISDLSPNDFARVVFERFGVRMQNPMILEMSERRGPAGTQ